MFLMPNCSVSIPSWETNGKPLSNTPTNVSFSVIKNDTLYFQLTNTQTVYMYFNLSVTGTTNPSYMVSIYDASTLNLVSTLTSNLLNLSTNIDLLSGVYIVCLRSLTGSFTGTARADYYGFGRVVTFEPIVYEATSAADFELKTDPRRKPCDKDMLWQLVDGKLPPGIVLNTQTGLLFGKLPYLDCLEDPDDAFNTIPSGNMFYTAGIGKYETVEPWGRRWNFKLRLSIVEQPDHYDERWFCLLIYNNWSRTREKFFNEYENGLIKGEIIKNVDQRYEVGLCEVICPGEPVKEDKEIFDEVIKDFLENGVQIDDDTDILHIEFNESKHNAQNPNSVNIYNIHGDSISKKEYVVEDDGDLNFGAYSNHHTTIEMDPEILNQRNVYVPEVQVGYISDDIMIQINSYEEFLGYRQYARFAIEDPNSPIYEYRDNKIFQEFLTLEDGIKYEYISYDPDVGIEGVEDSKDISEEVQHFIYITREVTKLPEVEELERISNKVKEVAPIELMHWQGESAEFNLTRVDRNNAII